MADNVKGAVLDIAKGVNEAVVNPVKDEFGQMVETGVQSITGNYPDPTKLQKKREEAEKKKLHAMQVIDWYAKVDQEQNKVRQEDFQKKTQQAQIAEQAKVKQFQVEQVKAKSLKMVQMEREKTKAERKGGLGG